jgi:cytochrome b subunit of formate dehydrogenase/nitrate/TMAO reductase-like tetraheme cytochrome c subunit
LIRLMILIFLMLGFGLFAQDNEYCMECHSDQDLTKTVNDSIEVSLFVNLEVLDNSIHADFACVDCHPVTEDHPDEGSVGEVACANCHEDVQEEYIKSFHGESHRQGVELAATCADCHGKHNILPSDDPKSKIYHANLAETCGSCHSKPEVNTLLGSRNINRVELYKNSVHWQRLSQDPNSLAATCTDCHGYHSIIPAIRPDAPLNVLNIPSTCGKCHTKEKEDYVQSIHWNSLEGGHQEAPVCTDCHGEHKIEGKKKRGGIGGEALESTRICASCHSSETLMQRFGLDPDRLSTYMKSYHGLAVLKGSPEAATCTSCHEVHAIRSAGDTLSSVNSANLVKTCSKCHKNVTATFAKIDVHPKDQKARNPIAYFFRIMYTWMIIVVIGGMFLHNLMIIVHFIREKKNQKKYDATYQRFQPFEVYQHMLMFLSFATLVVTGFALKFPDAGWVKLLLYIGMDEPVRSVVHRIAACVMIAISLVQLFYFIFSPKGRKDFIALIPTRDDLIHLWQNFMFYLGFSKDKPAYGRYDYGEKAEYLALIWGVIVMGASGFVLWFPEFFMKYLPSWAFETAEVVHYYEAWLATLAILIWHWFFVIFHPEKYPMSTTWMDGKVTEEEMKHHHPLEYEKIKGETPSIKG